MIDPDRLAHLLDQHAAALELYAAQWTDQPADVVQEAFLQLVRSHPLPERIVPWLYRVVRNGALSAARSRSRRQKHEQIAAELQNELTGTATDAETFDARTAAEMLQRLPETEREIVVARIWGQLTFDEIAELAGLSRSTVHRQYLSALKHLRRLLGVPCEPSL